MGEQTVRHGVGSTQDAAPYADGAAFFEVPGFNVFAAKDNEVSTPDRGVLEGVTRKTVIERAAQRGIPLEARSIPADEVFLSSTEGGIIPVTTVDGEVVGGGEPGQGTRRLRDAYWALHERPAFLPSRPLRLICRASWKLGSFHLPSLTRDVLTGNTGGCGGEPYICLTLWTSVLNQSASHLWYSRVARCSEHAPLKVCEIRYPAIIPDMIALSTPCEDAGSRTAAASPAR